MGYHDGPNLYPYVFSSPLSYVDPNGAQIRLPGHGVDPEIGPLPPIPGGVDPLPPHPGGIVCNLTSHDIVVCGTDLLHRPQPCIVLHPGECSAQQLEDADFWFIPGHGWYKCRWNSWCSPSDVEPDDGWPGRPWHPDDHPLITWPMPTLPSTCDNFCRSLANGTPDPCLAWSVCMAQCMQAGQPGVPGVPNCPFTPNDPGRQIAGVGGVGGM